MNSQRTTSLPNREALLAYAKSRGTILSPPNRREHRLSQWRVWALLVAVVAVFAIATAASVVFAFIFLLLASLGVRFNELRTYQSAQHEYELLSGFSEGTTRFRTFEIASIWSRIGAEFTDAALSAAFGFGLIGVFRAIGVDYEGSFEESAGTIAVLTYLFSPIVFTDRQGRGIGKRLFRITLMRANGLEPTTMFVLRRDVLIKRFGLLALTIPTFGLVPFFDCIFALRDPEGRSMHDRIVDTRVVRRPA